MSRRKLNFLDRILLLAAFILAAALILGFSAWRFDPRDYPLVAFFGLAYPFFLALNIVMILLWALRKRWAWAAATLLLIVLGWTALNSTWGFSGNNGEGPKVAQDAIRIMTYNVHNFKPYGEVNDEATKEQMLDVVEQENPDIVCFQEYYSRRKGRYDITDSLKKMLKTKEYYFLPSYENDYESMGLAIFSRYPIKRKGDIAFYQDRTGNASIYIDVEVNKQVLRVYNVHLQSISFNPEDYDYLDKVTKKMEPEISSSKRIARMLKSAFLKRSAQVDIMKAHFETCTTPFVVAGDFNDTPASYAVTQLTRNLNNAFVKQGTGLGKTYNGKFPNFQIDYIAATKNIEILNHKIIKAKLSDHFPVRSDLRLNP